MVSQYMALQVEATGELFTAPLSGARQLPLLPGVDVKLVLAQEPGVVKHLLAVFTRQLD